MQAFIVLNYWTAPSNNFENYHKPPFHSGQLIWSFEKQDKPSDIEQQPHLEELILLDESIFLCHKFEVLSLTK